MLILPLDTLIRIITALTLNVGQSAVVVCVAGAAAEG